MEPLDLLSGYQQLVSPFLSLLLGWGFGDCAGMKGSPSPEGKHILLWQLERSTFHLEQASRLCPFAVLVPGWYLASTWGMLHLFRKREESREKLITAVQGGDAGKFWLSPRCAELVLFSTFSSLWSCVGGLPGLMHPHLLLPSPVP